MARLNKREFEKIEKQMTTIRRGETWVGYRPTVMQSKKHNKKSDRRNAKALCRAYA